MVTIKDKDDLFEGLKLSKPESRMIVGSYYQRSIPFRSASFSQVHYSPGDRKYVRQISRKSGSIKKKDARPPVPVENIVQLPQTDADALQLTMTDEAKEKTIVQPVINPNTENRCPPQSINKEENDNIENVSTPAVDSNSITNRLSLAETQSSENLAQTTSIPKTIDVALSDLSSNITSIDVPERPKRNKSKTKQHCRSKQCDRLYLSDENIFALESDGTVETARNRVESVENISITIITPQNSDTETDYDNIEPKIVDISFVNDPTNSASVEVQLSNVDKVVAAAATVEPSDKSVAPSQIDVPAIECDDNTPHLSSAASTTIERTDNEKLKVDTAIATEQNSFDNTGNNSLSSPEDWLRPQWPTSVMIRSGHYRNRLTPQTSTERDDEPDASFVPRNYHVFSRGDSFSEAESDQGDKQSILPGAATIGSSSLGGRLSPTAAAAAPNEFTPTDSDSRLSPLYSSRGSYSPVPYSKRPLRGPYLEMIVNEQKKPENVKNNFRHFQLIDGQGDWTTIPVGADCNAIDDYYLRPSNTNTAQSKVSSNCALPKRKISANIPFCTDPSSSLKPSSYALSDDKNNMLPLVHHQRTISSPSKLEYYPDQMCLARETVPRQQLLQQLLRGTSERSLISDHDLMKKIYPTTPTYKDTRSHIVVELYDTERSYVESLQILVTKYLQPLKNNEYGNLIESYVVEEIFYKIPEILTYHEIFLEELRIRLDGWNTRKCIGDIFLETFTKPALIDAYIAFINNWKTAKESVKQTCHTKPAFARFLEAMTREHKGKLALDSLLIMPVQRIPRYELLIQSLIKHTELCHPDYDKLQEALRQIHELATRINCTERDSLELEQIENLIVGLTNLVTGDRNFLRYDLVTMTSSHGPNRKERALFLFNDLLIITSVKRRSGTVKKTVSPTPGSITSTLEANKYKLLTKIPLEHVDIVKVKDDNLRRMMRETEYLTEDVNTLSQMVDLVATLHCPHAQMEENIREMLIALNKQLNERHFSESQLSYLELAVNTRNSVENISVIFSKPEKRTTWEETFLEARARLNVSGDRRLNPEFLTSVPIRKTRAGLQFTCAAASYNQQDVWVCNSDGYVGQVCILTISPEPTVTSCNGVCNARILSVASIPVSQNIEKCQDTLDMATVPNSPNNTVSITHKTEATDNTNESIPVENLGRDIPDIYLDSSSSSDEDDDDVPSDDQKCSDNATAESNESTMWLGTEDGLVHIYNSTDSLRIKRNRLKIQHNSAVYCIIYVERNVFVSLANGEVYVYSWCPNYGWNTTDPTIIPVGSASSPVTRMFLVCEKLWCVCHNIVKTLNIRIMKVDNSFSIIGENNRAITSVAVSGLSVYLSLQNSAVLRVIHAISCEVLAEINIAPAVTKMLSGVDDIIRQHKAACLRITSLLACKELLWIGTSAGVILTMSLPNVKQDTSKITNIPHLIGLPHGHTGHVRFLTAVKYKNKKKEMGGRRSSKILERKPELSDVNKMLIISGGDGYEDFRSSSVSEIAGREDSTNHLLIWRF